MTEPLRCDCGAVLLDRVSETGVVPAGASEEIPFRRDTDHVVCESCSAMHRVGDLRARIEARGSQPG